MIRTTPIPKKKVSVKETKKVKAKGKGKSRKGVGGPKSTYSEEKRKQILLLTAEGLTDEKIAKVLGISYPTLWSWKKNNPELLNTIKENKELWDQQIVRSLKARALGYSCPEIKVFCNHRGEITTKEVIKHYPPDPTSMIFWLSNRQRENWKRNAETGTVTEPVSLVMDYVGKEKK